MSKFSVKEGFMLYSGKNEEMFLYVGMNVTVVANVYKEKLIYSGKIIDIDNISLNIENYDDVVYFSDIVEIECD